MTQAILAKMKCVEALLLDTPEGEQIRFSFKSMTSHTENGFFEGQMYIYGRGFEVGQIHDFELRILKNHD